MRIILILDKLEADGLGRLARDELRGLSEQLRWILRAELARRGMLPGDRSLSGKPGKEGSGEGTHHRC